MNVQKWHAQNAKRTTIGDIALKSCVLAAAKWVIAAQTFAFARATPQNGPNPLVKHRRATLGKPMATPTPSHWV